MLENVELNKIEFVLTHNGFGYWLNIKFHVNFGRSKLGKYFRQYLKDFTVYYEEDCVKIIRFSTEFDLSVVKNMLDNVNNMTYMLMLCNDKGNFISIFSEVIFKCSKENINIFYCDRFKNMFPDKSLYNRSI